VDFPFTKGSSASALRSSSSIVLSSGLAEKIFGTKDPLNETLTLGLPFGDFEYTVTGVFDENAYDSHIDANFFLSMENQDFGPIIKNWTNWASNNIFYTYAKLQEGTDQAAFEVKLKDYFDRKANVDLKEMGIDKSLFFQPFRDIYLHSGIDFELGKTGNVSTLYIFGTVAIFILLIACINFMNLTTARSERRAREVGVRKLLGANRSELMRQFLLESIVIAIAGFIVAAVVVSLVLPYFSVLIGTEINGSLHWMPWAISFSLCVVAGILAGIYPAFFLSGFKPIAVLKGRFKGKLSGFSIREVLVVVQFCIAACLILMVFVIKNQMAFVQQTDLGFNKDQQLVIPLRGEKAVQSFEALKNGLLQDSQIKSVTVASTYPGVESIEDMMYYTEGNSVDDVIQISHAYVGNDFVETLGFEMIAGRSYTDEITADIPLIILNESAVRKLGYGVEEAVGKKLLYDWRGETHTLIIHGVVKDFHFQSLHRSIQPYGFRNGNNGGHLIANFAGGNATAVLESARTQWEKAGISEPFTYSFLDQDFQRNYEKEERAARIIIAFAILALFVACLGLYGLTAFMTEQRTKEIGIRKTMGATDLSIVTLLSKDFGKTVLLAILISVPFSIYLSKAWLENFEFKIDLQWWYFLVAGSVALLIAMVTVSFQSIRTALMNPVESLRSK
ncbi:MAG TPA: FtsX-like permease family protein, partial [Algoriphagus sp.]|nr:FtsX-like permease family protein [Algoriphagus sp.]